MGQAQYSETHEEKMNEKTAKLLKRYAAHTEKNMNDLKRWWNSLSWEEKTRERERIKKEMAEEEEA